MKPNEIIQRWREGMGWDREDSFMSARVGMSWSCYYDVEAHEHEAFDVVPLMHMRRIAEAIGIPIHELFGLEACDDAPLQSRRHVYIGEARRTLGASIAVMSDGVGFYECFVESLELHPAYLETYPYDVLCFVADYLRVPRQHLFGRLENPSAPSSASEPVRVGQGTELAVAPVSATDRVRVNDKVREGRERLGWSAAQMAKRSGLATEDILRVEALEETLQTVTPLMNARRIAEAIGVPIISLFCLAPVAPRSKRAYTFERVAEARRQRGVTLERMAEDLGLDRVCTMAIETDPSILEIYPCKVLLSVAGYLGIPPQYLVDPPEY